MDIGRTVGDSPTDAMRLTVPVPSDPAADPYTPHSGDRRWSAEHYELRLDYRVATNRLDGTATITARALEPSTGS